MTRNLRFPAVVNRSCRFTPSGNIFCDIGNLYIDIMFTYLEMSFLRKTLIAASGVLMMVADATYGRILPGLDNCLGRCVNLTGYFCAPFLGICEPCDSHCEEQNGDGCMETCKKWEAVPISTTAIAQTTLQLNSTSTEPVQPQDSNVTSMGLVTSTSSVDGSIGTGSPELPEWVYFALLAAGIIFSFIIWRVLKKCRCGDQKQGQIGQREVERAGQIDIELNDLGVPRNTPPPDAAAPLLHDEPSQSGRSQDDQIRSVSSEPSGDPTQPLRGTLSVRCDSAYETAAPCDVTVAIVKAPGSTDGRDFDAETASPAGSLTDDVRARPVQRELYLGAVPFHGQGEPFMNAMPSIQNEPTTPIGQTVQDGTLSGHELAMSPSSPLDSYMNGEGVSHHHGLVK